MRVCDLNPFLRFASALLYEQAYNDTVVRVTDHRLFYIFEGEARLTIGSEQYPLLPGCVFYCCAGSRYSIHTAGALRLVSLNFDLTQRCSDRFQPISPSREPDRWDTMPIFADPVEDSSFLNGYLYLESAAHLQDKLLQIVEDFSSGDRYGRELSSATLKGLLTALHRQQPEQLPPKLAQVQAYIQNHYADPITNKTLAELVGYHEYYLNRIFTQYTGLSLHSYLLQVRIARASFLILNTDMELKAIPEQVGFGSYPHFSGYFKQIYGCSPAQYRKRLRASI